MNATHNWKKSLDLTEKAEASSYELMAQPENEEENDWLAPQFRRIPFVLYKFWLIVHFPIIFTFNSVLLYSLVKAFTVVDGETFTSADAFLTIGFIFFLYGCCQMLYAMNKKKSRIAQGGYVKFQYAFISSLISLVDSRKELMTRNNVITWLTTAYIGFSQVVNLVGGFAVLKVFKKNHPLTRLDALRLREGEDKDFLEQNEAIASEFSKYDEQLDRWPYAVYSCLLKFLVLYEILSSWETLLLRYYVLWGRWREDQKLNLKFDDFTVFFWDILTFLSVYSCIQTEIAMRTKNLAKVKGALVLLMIHTPLVMLHALHFIFFEEKDSDFVFELAWIALMRILNVVSLIGALKIKKILEQRDIFVKMSSYSEDAYL